MGRPARVRDIDELARALPEVTCADDDPEHPAYQVRGKTFCFFRTPRGDALDEDGSRLEDVIVFWVPTAADKNALVHDQSPFFTTPHFDGHPSVLLRASRMGEISRDELAEVLTEAWLARAPKSVAKAWLER